MKLGLQLYTLRSHIKNGEDLLSILEKVKEIGFEGVEFASYHGLSAEMLRARLEELELSVAGTHLSFDELSGENLQRNIAFMKTLGGSYIGTSGHSTRKEADLLKIEEVMGNAAREAAKEGITAYYHNHSHEFKKENDEYKLERIGRICKLELDTYWSFFAKADTPGFLRKHAQNIPLVHIKDGSAFFPKPKALGEGKNDLKAIIAAAKEAGCEWLVLENDFPKPDGLSDITRSMAYLKANV